jgi:hypothetical protein
MKDKIWFVLGLSCLSMVLGDLVGGSHSPVAGVAITAAFGLAVPLFTLLGSKSADTSADQLNIAGKVLSIFCVVFVVGLVLGASSRLTNWPAPHRVALVFPWKDQAPKTAYHAVDWLIVRDRLRSIGYTEEQVKQLYAIQQKEWGSSEPSGSYGGLSALFADKKMEKADPGGLFVYEPPDALKDSSHPPI